METAINAQSAIAKRPDAQAARHSNGEFDAVRKGGNIANDDIGRTAQSGGVWA
jgi:hypothetical protein